MTIKPKTLAGSILVLLAVLTICPAQPATSSADTLLRSFDEVLLEVSKIRQVESLAPIEKGIKSKEQIRTYILDRINEEYRPEDVAAEARLLKRLGLIPEEMDLRAFMIDLLTEQIAGFYDPRTKTFYIADWIPLELQKPVMAHELIHALQDQRFDLEKYLSPIEGNDDRSVAQAAVIEGEGLLAMLAYTLAPFGRDVLDLDIIELNRVQRPMVEAEYPTFARAPAYLKEMMLFPYTYGANFVQKYIQSNDWKSLDRLYRSFPSSSEQVIHPEKALRLPDPPSEVDALDFAGRQQAELVYENVLGEFGLFLYLSNHLDPDEAERASRGWDGDHVAVYSKPSGGEVLTVNSVWDSERDAEEFFGALQQSLQSLAGSEIDWEPVPVDGGKGLSGRAGDRRFSLMLSGAAVSLVDQDS